MPARIQRKRTKGWRMPDGAVNCTRPGKWGNPFRVGEYWKIGKGSNGMSRLRALAPEYADSTFTLIETPEQAVAMFRLYHERYPLQTNEIEELRGHDLACWCGLDKVCHVDVLLELVNGASVKIASRVRALSERNIDTSRWTEGDA